MNYSNMEAEEIRETIIDLVRELKKAAFADNLELVVILNGRGKEPFARIIDINGGDDLE